MALTETLLSKEQSTVELSEETGTLRPGLEYRYDFSKPNLGQVFQLILEFLRHYYYILSQ